MKKNVKRIMVLGTVICMLLASSACGTEKNDNSYKVKEVSISATHVESTDEFSSFYVDENGTYHIEKIFVPNPIKEENKKDDFV